ncbi:hypothetical protein DSO57_1010026 [Entomophthora muscae]|uniref:Uncharacterized protein n=1 Tax=Entomophthora muscae TaxID=34485 RepID=A0ACC2RXR0_9FUNG|nr:hypothetical protein DSO57_1010026 [Entomophthora muscae]
MHEGYFWGKAKPVSKPATCPNNATCKVVQDLPYTASWDSTFASHQILALIASPIPPQTFAVSATALSTNLSLSFSGPGEAHMVFHPLVWQVHGRLSLIRNHKGNVTFKEHSITINLHVVDSQRTLFGKLSLGRQYPFYA